MTRCVEGWNWLFNSRKWHYFDAGGRSLCGRYLTLGTNVDAEQDLDDSPSNCAACRRKVLARKAATR